MIKQNKKIKFYSLTVLISALFLFTNNLFSQSQVYIPVGEAKVKKTILAIARLKFFSSESPEIETLSRLVRDTLYSDLSFTSLFVIQNEAAFIEKPQAGITLDQFQISDWKTIGTEILLKTGISLTKNQISVEARLYNVPLAKQIFGKKYLATKEETKLLAHTLANDIVAALTGKSSIFTSKIVMTCDKSGHKEIWMMDYDGSNPKQLTHHRSLAFAPAFSRDNKKIAYSVYTKNSKNIQNINLYELDLGTKKSILLSNRQGINSGAVYSPDGKKIALTMSFLGNPEIFLLDLFTKQVTRLTKTLGFDVDPSFSPDGKELAFVSTRTGQPHVYIMNIATQSVRRLTFAGKYNATPDWSLDGSKIVFAGYLENKFDLFLINPDGTNLERLTKNEGSNEDPRFSSDGQYIAFTSNRTGQKNIYVITVDGLTTKRLTYGLGNCEAPRWSYPEN
jgi:TolB protein